MKNSNAVNNFVSKLLLGIFLLSGLVPNVANAAVDNLILVRGKVANVWTKEKVKITDHFNQTYYLPRMVFPKDFVFQSGKTFTVEITTQQLDQLEVIK